MTRKLTLTAWSAGIVIFIALVIYHGAATVTAAVAAAGWGLLIITFFHLVPMVADTLAWRALLNADTRPALYKLLWMRWIGESVNSLLPAAQIGGDLVRGRLAARQGVPLTQAAASIIVDLTISVLTLVIFSCIGVLLAVKNNDQAFISLISGLVVSILIIAVVLKLQHAGMFGILVRYIGRVINHREWDRIVGGAAIL